MLSGVEADRGSAADEGVPPYPGNLGCGAGAETINRRFFIVK
jgi:hypothetical protein